MLVQKVSLIQCLHANTQHNRATSEMRRLNQKIPLTLLNTTAAAVAGTCVDGELPSVHQEERKLKHIYANGTTYLTICSRYAVLGLKWLLLLLLRPHHHVQKRALVNFKSSADNSVSVCGSVACVFCLLAQEVDGGPAHWQFRAIEMIQNFH